MNSQPNARQTFISKCRQEHHLNRVLSPLGAIVTLTACALLDFGLGGLVGAGLLATLLTYGAVCSLRVTRRNDTGVLREAAKRHVAPYLLIGLGLTLYSGTGGSWVAHLLSGLVWSPLVIWMMWADGERAAQASAFLTEAADDSMAGATATRQR